MSARTCYDTLGLRATASHREVQEAYRRLAFRLHPDIAGDDPAARAEFTRITRAYRTIAALDRLRERTRQAGCCSRCGEAGEMLAGLDGRPYCGNCILESRRRFLPLPLYRTVYCLSVVGLQAAALVLASRYALLGGHGFAAAALTSTVASLVALGVIVFRADRIDA